ncbi:unnamed protein product [Hymenolepis diminuta]|uniref:CUPID domain-containing protein n=1 Tax=Hymenolepis diminuta TaxID=6216 RepID=A0A0R3SX02_HYMDI|nr:unnamed protein product [Hymenolepis diminuta]
MMQLEQQITELELELPRRATDYEYAAWQVKDQLRQARGIETKLSLNQPSTDETRQLQHRVAQIRVFLEQDIFKEKVRSTAPQSIQPKSPPTFNPTVTLTSTSSPSDTEDHSYIEPPYNENDKSPKNPPLSTMPSLPEPLLGKNTGPIKPPISGSPSKPISYNLDVYPKLPGRLFHTPVPDNQSLSPSIPVRDDPGYPESRGNFEMDPPASVSSPQTWKRALHPTDQGSSKGYAKGQLSGQIIESEDMPTSNRPPIHPKPKVAPRGTADPQIITPDYYADSPASGGFGIDPKFSSLKVIQSGYTKKRIDLFEAL